MAKTRVAPDPNLGKNIAALMAAVPELGSQPLLAARSGLAQSTIGRILRGEVDPTAGNLRKIAKAFGVPVETLYWTHERFVEALRSDRLREIDFEELALDMGRLSIVDPDSPSYRPWLPPVELAVQALAEALMKLDGQQRKSAEGALQILVSTPDQWRTVATHMRNLMEPQLGGSLASPGRDQAAGGGS